MKQLLPFISIIIPTYNRPKQLAICLQALVRQEYPHDGFEVIVVDDGSKISLNMVIAPFCKQVNLTLLKQINAGPAAARNTGAKHAKGDFLAFTDDDCTPSENWLSVFATQFEETPDCIIGGKIIYNLSSNAYAVASQMILDIVYQNYNRDHKHAHFFSICNMAVPTKLFLELGGLIRISALLKTGNCVTAGCLMAAK